MRVAVEWQEYHDSLCVGCGTPRDEAMNPANQFRYTATALRCFPCQAREARAWQWNKKRSEGASPEFGVYWAVELDPE